VPVVPSPISRALPAETSPEWADTRLPVREAAGTNGGIEATCAGRVSKLDPIQTLRYQ